MSADQRLAFPILSSTAPGIGSKPGNGPRQDTTVIRLSAGASSWRHTTAAGLLGTCGCMVIPRHGTPVPSEMPVYSRRLCSSTTNMAKKTPHPHTSEGAGRGGGGRCGRQTSAGGVAKSVCTGGQKRSSSWANDCHTQVYPNGFSGVVFGSMNANDQSGRPLSVVRTTAAGAVGPSAAVPGALTITWAGGTPSDSGDQIPGPVSSSPDAEKCCRPPPGP